MTPAEQLHERVETLKARILEEHPQMPELLREIHSKLKEDPDLVTILAPEEVHVIVKGLSVVTKTTLIATPTKTPTAKLKQLKLDDI